MIDMSGAIPLHSSREEKIEPMAVSSTPSDQNPIKQGIARLRTFMRENTLSIMNGFVFVIGLIGCSYAKSQSILIFGRDNPRIYNFWFIAIFITMLSVLLIRKKYYSIIALIEVFLFAAYSIDIHYYMLYSYNPNKLGPPGFYLPDILSIVIFAITSLFVMAFIIKESMKYIKSKKLTP